MSSKQFWIGIVIVWILVFAIVCVFSRDIQLAFWLGIIVNAIWAPFEMLVSHLNKKAERMEDVERLIREMGSRDNGTAIKAVEALRSIGLITNGSMRGVSFLYANLNGAPLDGAILSNVDLRFAKLEKIRASHTVFVNSNLSCAHLEGAYLHEADLRGADLSGAYLHNAILNDAHLEGANLGGAHLEGAVMLSEAYFSERTILPDYTCWTYGIDMSKYSKITLRGFK